MLYQTLLSIHSVLRYVILILLIVTIVRSFKAWLGSTKDYSGIDAKYALFTLITAHLQLVLGLALYSLSPAVSAALSAGMTIAMHDKILRFWFVEHITMMIIAVALITVGRSLSKRTTEGAKKHKRIAIYYTASLLLILLSIPWPFSGVARPWF